MLVVFEEESYETQDLMDHDIFCSWQLSSPDKMVTILKQGHKKEVRIIELQDYSVWRNVRCFK